MHMILAITMVILFSGCTGNGERLPMREYAFHTLNLIDAGQTMHVARSPECWRESGVPTKYILGDHPNQSEVLPLFLVYSAVYHYANRWLDKRPKYRTFQRIYNVSMIGAKAWTVYNNNAKGLDPWGRGC